MSPRTRLNGKINAQQNAPSDCSEVAVQVVKDGDL